MALENIRRAARINHRAFNTTFQADNERHMAGNWSEAFNPGEAPDFQRHQWIWWIFSLYYFIPAFYLPFSWGLHSLIVIAYASFILFSFVAAGTSRKRAWQPILGIVVLAAATTFFTPGASSFFSYAGFFIGFSFSTKKFLYWLVGIMLIIIALQYANHYPIPYFLFPAMTGLVTIGLVGIIERLRYEAKLKEQQSHQEIRQLAVIAERERIARDLHDILGHTLSSIALKAELAEKLLAQQKISEGQQHLLELNKIARDTLSLVRQTVSGYKHRGLAGEVTQLCEQLRQNRFSATLSGDLPKLSARAETALILALTELTTNILRHSNGKDCRMEFRQEKNLVSVTVCDDGEITSLNEGNGLRGIRERLNALAGNLEITLTNGSCFTITLPAREIS